MAFLNYFLQFKAVADKSASNSPSLTNLNWVRDVQGVQVSAQSGQFLTIAAGATVAVIPASSTKKFLYLESSGALDAILNGSVTLTIQPVVIGSSTQPGSLLLNSLITQLSLHNTGANPVTVFVAHAE